MTQYSWTVIGAGPAGIAAVGRLLDHGIAPEEIAWIDPEFSAGDLGGKWRAVPGNTHVASFLDYLTASPSFRFSRHLISSSTTSIRRRRARSDWSLIPWCGSRSVSVSG